MATGIKLAYTGFIASAVVSVVDNAVEAFKVRVTAEFDKSCYVSTSEACHWFMGICPPPGFLEDRLFLICDDMVIYSIFFFFFLSLFLFVIIVVFIVFFTIKLFKSILFFLGKDVGRSESLVVG